MMKIFRKTHLKVKIMIKKAVIAAAGRGTRFLPVVKGYPKELVPILSKPNIQYLIEQIPQIDEVSIGHALISEALYLGLENTIQMYLRKIELAQL